MRIQRYVFTLATAATLAASSAPAWAFDARAPEGPSVVPSPTTVQRPSTDTTDWLVGTGAAGALAVGGGLIVLRRRSSSTSRLHLGAGSSRAAARTQQRRAPTA